MLQSILAQMNEYFNHREDNRQQESLTDVNQQQEEKIPAPWFVRLIDEQLEIKRPFVPYV